MERAVARPGTQLAYFLVLSRATTTTFLVPLPPSAIARIGPLPTAEQDGGVPAQQKENPRNDIGELKLESLPSELVGRQLHSTDTAGIFHDTIPKSTGLLFESLPVGGFAIAKIRPLGNVSAGNYEPRTDTDDG